MYSVPGDTTSLVPGFPIRTSSDQRSVDSSPRHIAASHVLHRLPVPRHPPCALKHLQHKTKKMSHHPHTPPPPKEQTCMRVSEKFALHKDTPQPQKGSSCVFDARNHYPQIKHHTPPPKQGNNRNPSTPRPPPTHPTIRMNQEKPRDLRAGTHPQRGEPAGLLSQSPIVCLMISSPSGIHSDEHVR